MSSDHFFNFGYIEISTRMFTFTQEHCPQKNTSISKIALLIDESIRWLYKQRIQQKLQEIPESSNIVWGGGTSKTQSHRQQMKVWGGT
jgi:hypothetical protein